MWLLSKRNSCEISYIFTLALCVVISLRGNFLNPYINYKIRFMVLECQGTKAKGHGVIAKDDNDVAKNHMKVIKYHRFTPKKMQICIHGFWIICQYFNVWSHEYWSHHSRDFGRGSLVFRLLVFAIDQFIFIYVILKSIPQHEKTMIHGHRKLKACIIITTDTMHDIILMLGHNIVVFGHAIAIFNFLVLGIHQIVFHTLQAIIQIETCNHI